MSLRHFGESFNQNLCTLCSTQTPAEYNIFSIILMRPVLYFPFFCINAVTNNLYIINIIVI